MSLEEMLDVWKEVRAGLITELAQIPGEQFGFQATPESRSVAGVIRHIAEAQKFLAGELLWNEKRGQAGNIEIWLRVTQRPLIAFKSGK